jgi:hypothetical protein
MERSDRPFGSGHGIGQQHDHIINLGGSLRFCGCRKSRAAMPAAGVACKKDHSAHSLRNFEVLAQSAATVIDDFTDDGLTQPPDPGRLSVESVPVCFLI